MLAAKIIYSFTFVLVLLVIGYSVYNYYNYEWLPKKPTMSSCVSEPDDFMKTQCFLTLAAQKEDIKICDSINNIEPREFCYSNVAVITKNLPVCYGIGETLSRDLCFSGIASESNDYELCGKIKDDSFRSQCQDNLKNKE
ncbi:MAG: hypothetical protein AAB657_04125 [Patescibacteria group bacterium]